MGEEDFSEEYFRWLIAFIGNPSEDFLYLFRLLHNTTFIPEYERDENRAVDGEDLRIRFMDEMGIDSGLMSRYLADLGPCTVLEMMLALAIRIECQIMEDDAQGNRTSDWFMAMVHSLGLVPRGPMKDPKRVAAVLDNFMHHRYAHDGFGGLFYIPMTPHNMRKAEIWYQMMWYLDYVLVMDDA